MGSLQDVLPPSLLLPPHLSAHKYFFVCTLTITAWDTLVLSPRAYRLFRSEGWPALKILFHFIRFLMPIEFTIVAVAFFDTKWSQATCQNFFLFEPICTAVLLAACSAIHVLRIQGIYDKSRAVLAGMGALLGIQVVVTAVASAFFRSVPLEEGQGCIAGPKHNWVGIYWVAPTLLYTVSFAMAVSKSLNSLQVRPLSAWKLMLRDGLNLYAAIWLVNMVNMLFWFIAKPTDDKDTIKTIVTSMAAVLTTSMTMRIVLSIRGPLVYGGSFALSNATGSTGAHSTSRSGTTHVISTGNSRIGTQNRSHTYTLDNIHGKSQNEWDQAVPGEVKPIDDKAGDILDIPAAEGVDKRGPGVKVAIDREVVYDNPYNRK